MIAKVILMHMEILLYSASVPVAEIAQPQEVDVATARFFRVLGDATRLRILELLLDRPHTVSELMAALGAPQGRVSNHLACLRWCRFVDDERQGRRVTYRIADARVGGLVALARQVASEHCDHLASCRRIGPDWI